MPHCPFAHFTPLSSALVHTRPYACTNPDRPTQLTLENLLTHSQRPTFECTVHCVGPAHHPGMGLWLAGQAGINGASSNRCPSSHRCASCQKDTSSPCSGRQHLRCVGMVFPQRGYTELKKATASGGWFLVWFSVMTEETEN